MNRLERERQGLLPNRRERVSNDDKTAEEVVYCDPCLRKGKVRVKSIEQAVV
jgi:hypothetical protein